MEDIDQAFEDAARSQSDLDWSLAFAQARRFIYAVCYRYFVERTANPSLEAEDVTQLVILKTYLRRRQFDPKLGTARAWLSKAALRRAIDYSRELGRLPALRPLPDLDILKNHRASSPKDPDKVSDDERNATIAKALASLDEIERSCLLARADCETDKCLSLRHIAKQLGLRNHAQAARLLKRAKEKFFRRYLQLMGEL